VTKNLFRFGILFIVFLLPLLLTMNGCGGGGGGGGANSGITYTGITTPATITSLNAEEITLSTYSGGEVGTSLSTGAVYETKIDHPRCYQLVRALEKTIHDIDMHTSLDVIESGTIFSESDTVFGACGGDASHTFQIDDVTGEFSGNFNYYSYCSDGAVINGSTGISGTIDLETEEITHITYTFSSLDVAMDDDSLTIDGEIEYDIPNSSSFTANVDMRMRDGSTGKVYWINNYTMTISMVSASCSYSINPPSCLRSYNQFVASGRFYYPDYGYVDLSTPTPFRIYSGSDCPSQGVMVCSGSNGTKARLTVNSTSYLVVDADTDGDGVYDWSSGSLSTCLICGECDGSGGEQGGGY
jgi:hypothetical protein